MFGHACSDEEQYLAMIKQGEHYFSEEKYEESIYWYQKAMNIDLFESPNYYLKFELGRSYCKQKRIKEGLKELTEFQKIAKGELHLIKCISKECIDMEKYSDAMFYACGCGPTELTLNEKNELQKKLNESVKIIEQCKK